MKVIGLFLIVSGHYTPPNYKYLYVFSVQSFFMISGFLSKPQAWEIFFKKILRQLIVPLLLLGSILVFINSIRSLISGTFSFSNQLHSFEGLLCGQQQALGGLWFVYTLIICRFIAQIDNIKVKGVIALLLLIGSYFYNNYSSHPVNNCWVNTLIAYPIFYIGEVSATRKSTFNFDGTTFEMYRKEGNPYNQQQMVMTGGTNTTLNFEGSVKVYDYSKLTTTFITGSGSVTQINCTGWQNIDLVVANSEASIF